MLKITIDTDNAAFYEDACNELARILGELSEGMLRGSMFQKDSGKIRDFNGDTVGYWEWPND